MALVIAHRTFRPRFWTTLLALVLFSAFIALGRWQLARAEYKRALFAEFAAGTDVTLSFAATGSQPLARYQHVSVSGRYDSKHQIVLDNMTHAELAGFRILTPFLVDDGRTLLVDRGWFVMGRTRTDWPSLEVSETPRMIRGRIDDLPVPGVRMPGAANEVLPQAWPKLMNYPAWPELEAAFGKKLHPDILLLDRSEPDGFTRDWIPPGFPPVRHIAYAVQWFAMALTLLILYGILNFRKESPA